MCLSPSTRPSCRCAITAALHLQLSNPGLVLPAAPCGKDWFRLDITLRRKAEPQVSLSNRGKYTFLVVAFAPAAASRFGMARGRLPALLLACSLSSLSHAEPLELEARRLELHPSTQGRTVLHAEGEVRLRLGECQLEANGLTVTSGSLIVAEQAWLRAGALELRAPRLVGARTGRSRRSVPRFGSARAACMARG